MFHSVNDSLVHSRLQTWIWICLYPCFNFTFFKAVSLQTVPIVTHLGQNDNVKKSITLHDSFFFYYGKQKSFLTNKQSSQCYNPFVKKATLHIENIINPSDIWLFELRTPRSIKRPDWLLSMYTRSYMILRQ